MGSAEREEWQKMSEHLTIGDMDVQEAHGFEPWFTLPHRTAASTLPARYETALTTIMALYPPLLAASTLLSGMFHGWPGPWLMLLTVILLVPAMTYFIMPWMPRAFRSLLHPESAASYRFAVSDPSD